VWLAAVLTAGALAGDAAAPAEPAEAALDPLKLLPAEAKDADVLASVDLAKLLGQPSMEAILRSMPIEEGAGLGMLERLKQYPKSELQAAAFVGFFPTVGGDNAFVLAASGRFNQAAIYDLATSQIDAIHFDYAGYDLLGTPAPEDEKAKFGTVIGVLDEKLLIIGSEALAKKAIDVYRGKADALSQTAPVVTTLTKVDGMLKAIVKPAVLPTDLWEEPIMKDEGFGPAKLKTITVGATMRRAILTVELIVTADSAESASILKDLLEEALSPQADKMTFANLIMPEMTVEGDAVKIVADADTRAVGMMLPVITYARAKDRTNLCMNNVKQLGVGCQKYLDGPGGHRYYPPSLKALVDSKVVDKKLFLCTEDRHEGAAWHCSYGCIFELTDKKLTDRLPTDAIIIWDDKPRHDGKRCVCFNDTHVESVSEAQFQQLLAKVKKLIAEMK